jgi:hypothetical protein
MILRGRRPEGRLAPEEARDGAAVLLGLLPVLAHPAGDDRLQLTFGRFSVAARGRGLGGLLRARPLVALDDANWPILLHWNFSSTRITRKRPTERITPGENFLLRY